MRFLDTAFFEVEEKHYITCTKVIYVEKFGRFDGRRKKCVVRAEILKGCSFASFVFGIMHI